MRYRPVFDGYKAVVIASADSEDSGTTDLLDGGPAPLTCSGQYTGLDTDVRAAEMKASCASPTTWTLCCETSFDAELGRSTRLRCKREVLSTHRPTRRLAHQFILIQSLAAVSNLAPRRSLS